MHMLYKQAKHFLLKLTFILTLSVTNSHASEILYQQISQENVNGRLYRPSCSDMSSITIVIGGSSGRPNENFSELLAQNCLNVFAITYFQAPHQPETLDSIPIETVNKAIQYLSNSLNRNNIRVNILGVSRGSELALWSASTITNIAAVAVIVPSSVTWHGQRTSTAWTYQDSPLPGLSFNRHSREPIFQRATSALSQLSDESKYFIPVEKIGAPLLLVSAKRDHVWPSYEMALQIEKRLASKNFAFSVDHLALDDDHTINEENQIKVFERLISHFNHE